VRPSRPAASLMSSKTNPFKAIAGAKSIRFGPFTVDLESQELFKSEIRLRIPGQSLRLLTLLLGRPRVLVTRAELRQALWPSDTFVDFDQGLNTAINRLRDALGDSADKPRYIETLPRRGYRFIAEINETSPNEARHLASTDGSAPAGRAATNSLSLRRFIVGGLLSAGVILAVAAGIAWRHSRRVEVSSSTSTPVPFTALPGEERSPAFSPDGSRIVFAWNGTPEAGGTGFDLYMKAVGSETQLRLTQHPSEWLSPAWSPDGTQIAFHRLAGRDSGIYVIPSLGGPERKLASTRIPYNVAAGISWSPDGKWIAFGNQSELLDRMFLVSVETLEVRPLTHDPACLAEGNPTFSHDGKKIFFSCVHSMHSIEIDSMPSAGGPSTNVLSPQNDMVGYALSGDDSRIVFSHGFGLQKLAVVNVEDHAVRQIEASDEATWPTISSGSDKLAYSTELQSISIWRRDLFHPEVPPVKIIPSTRPQNSPQYSPDEKHIAFESKRGGSWALWVSDVDGGNLVNLSRDIWGSGAPRWSPDGKKIAFDTASENPSSIYVVDIADGVPRKLRADVDDIKLPAWSHDGNWLYFTSDVPQGHNLYRVPAEGGKSEQITSGAPAMRPAESADGAYLYFASREVHFHLEKLALSDVKREVQKEAIPPILQWTLWQLAPGGIYYVPSGAPKSMRYFELASQRTKEMFKLDKDFDDGFSVSPDGRYLLYSQLDEENADIAVMNRYR
jgi:Tol biopolymer transport system component/DNA-binding winged helix-turn-helix (wHTH) protein